MLRNGIGCDQIEFAVALAAVVFAPVHLSGIGREIAVSEPVMRSDLSAAQTAKKDSARLVQLSSVLYASE